MAINFGIKDVRTIVNQLHNQMTDRTALEPTNTGEFVSQATLPQTAFCRFLRNEVSY